MIYKELSLDIDNKPIRKEKMLPGYDYYFRGKDGIQKIRITSDSKVGMSKTDKYGRVLFGYERFMVFISKLVYGKKLTDKEYDKFTINGYYPTIGVNLEDFAISYNIDKLEGYEFTDTDLEIKINFGNNTYKDICVIKHPIKDYDIFMINNIILMTKYSTDLRYYVGKNKFV